MANTALEEPIGNAPISSLYTMSSSQNTKGSGVGCTAQANVGDWAETCRWSNSVAQGLLRICLLRRWAFSRYLLFECRSGNIGRRWLSSGCLSGDAPIDARSMNKRFCEPMITRNGSQNRWASDYVPHRSDGTGSDRGLRRCYLTIDARLTGMQCLPTHG